jgi:putative FmdB family regulatory protein
MPTYSYACDKCGHHFDKFQSMKDAALKICPEDACARKRWGKGKVRRQMGTGAGLIFKGSGFYITDYRSEGYKAAAKADKPAGDAKPAADKPAKTESKPAKPAKSAA